MSELNKEEKLKFVLDYITKNELTAYMVGTKAQLNIAGIQRIMNGDVKNPQKETVEKLYNCIKNWDSENDSLNEPITSGYDRKIEQIQENIKLRESIISESKDSEQINHQKEMISLLKTKITIIEEAEKNHNLDK